MEPMKQLWRTFMGVDDEVGVLKLRYRSGGEREREIFTGNTGTSVAVLPAMVHSQGLPNSSPPNPPRFAPFHPSLLTRRFLFFLCFEF